MDSTQPPSAPKISGVKRLLSNNKLFAPKAAPILKMFSIGFLLLLMLVPISLISSVIEERQYRQRDTAEEFSRTWGPSQVVESPVLVIPLQKMRTSILVDENQNRRKEIFYETSYIRIELQNLKFNGKLMTQERHRGLFHATVYTAQLEMSGKFRLPTPDELERTNSDIISWNKAFLTMRSLGLDGMTPDDHGGINGLKLPWKNCADVAESSTACTKGMLAISTPLLQPDPISPMIPFEGTLTLRGTDNFSVKSHARELVAHLSADWPIPSFQGTVLPNSSQIEATGFEANWQAMNYADPQSWIIRSQDTLEALNYISNATIGVSLLEETPIYRMVERSSKYGMLFLALSFTTYFLLEIISGIRIHIVQYALLGGSVSLFGLLLLALSEAIGYQIAFVISAALVIIQSSFYTLNVTRRLKPTLVFAIVLSALFGFNYAILGLEQYSLLVGTFALFLVLSIIMIVTRSLDWSAKTSNSTSSSSAAVE